MPDEKIVKSVFHTLNALHGHGFSTWVTKAYDLAQVDDIDMSASVALTAKQFKSLCSERTKYVFVENWHIDLHDEPLLRSYRLYKNEFSSECYLDYINVPKFRISQSKIRPSSHDLEIERGRYTRSKTDPKQRLCAWCLEVEDDVHFIPRFQINVKFYIQRLDPSTNNFRMLVTTNNSYFSCPAKTGKY